MAKYFGEVKVLILSSLVWHNNKFLMVIKSIKFINGEVHQ